MTVATRQSYSTLTTDQEKRALEVQRRSLVIDAIGSSIVNPEPQPVAGKSYIERALEAGVNAVNVTLASGKGNDTFDFFLRRVQDYIGLLDAKPESTRHIETVEDLDDAQRTGRLGVIFGIQTGAIVGREMWRWPIVRKLGVRIVQLTYNERNYLGDGCLESENRGLTSYGKQTIQELNRLGMCVDLSHVGERTALDATGVSRKPVIYSHSNPRAMGPSVRNLTDEQMREMAATGGVMGISQHSMLCHKVPGVQPTVDDMLDMIDYTVALIGVDHVGIGSDVYDSYTKLSWETTTKRAYPSGFVFETMRSVGFGSVSEFPNVTRGLVARGYADDEISKILGGNWRRVFQEVWAD